MQIDGASGLLARLVFAISLIVGYICLGMAYDALLFSSPF